jgi:hypothetical protein
MDRAAKPLVSPATAYVGDVGVDLGVGRVGILLEESNRRHDLTGLAIAALRHVFGQPSLLHRMLAVGRKPFDGGDAGAGQRTDRDRTGAHGPAINVNGAGTALRDPTAEFRAGEPDGVAQRPEQGRIRFQVDIVLGSVDRERDHRALFGCKPDLTGHTASG